MRFQRNALLAVALMMVSSPALSEEGNRERPTYADNPTPSVRFLSPKNGDVLESGSVLFEVETQNYKFDYDMATTPGDQENLPISYASVVQEPNSGHVHVYVQKLNEDEIYDSKDFVMPNSFLMPENFKMPDRGNFTLNDLPGGEYRVLVELTQHDHGPRVKFHPRDWPSLDVIYITLK